MKRDRIWMRLLIVALVLLVSGAVTWVSAEEQVTVTGVLVQSKRKIYLTTAGDKFMVVGQDFSNLIGRKVKITGKVMENYRGKSLVVSVIEIVGN